MVMDIQMYYAIQLPKRVVFGSGIADKIGGEAKLLGAKRALIVTDETMEKKGLCDKVEKPLREVLEEVEVFDKVESEPTLAIADEVVRASKNNYDLVVGIGGGSVLDMAKVASAAAANPEQEASAFLGANKIKNPSVSKILIPTTAGTGSEATPFALVVVEGKKKAIASSYNLADVVFIDATFTATMPPRVTAFTGMDALSHAIEAFLSLGANPLTDSFALEAMGKISNNLEEAFLHGDNLNARMEMSLAAMLAGIAFGNAGVIAGHAIAHAFGARYKVPHGVSAALTLPYIMEYNASAPAVGARMKEIATALVGEKIESAEEAASKAIACVRSMIERLELPARLSELNVPKEDLSKLAEDVEKEKGYLKRNPREMGLEDAMKLLESMW
ncbi:MAG: alcohol dehydrogenase [Candidatus Methanophagaceae archaeon]|nr:MAG: alcohol dehydrogenase [Methanophagales archaeon]